jgi:hypothetical protein
VKAVVGLPGPLVRPRWQVEPPAFPPPDVTWVSIGIDRREAETYANVIHLENAGHPQGADMILRQEALDLRCTFFGPDADAAAERLRAGIHVTQNRDGLRSAGVGLTSVGSAIAVPALINDRWVYGIDVTVYFCRAVGLVYDVRTVSSVPDVKLST